ncbi:MAG TPA: FAD-binding oxidoreductase [Thermoleophilaceae bacterium]|jgi:FAD/FMN-containing dehydrogenase
MTTTAVLDERREEFAASFGGLLVGPDDATYEELRRCHNGLVDKRPALITCCRGPADVIEAIRFAAEEGLELAVRGGGHNVSGRALSEGGLVVDLSLMRGVDVDARARTARVQGGALWTDVNREAAVHGLAVTGGAVSTTGVGGYTLGGGLGWLMGVCGLAADNLLEAEVVLASGELVRAAPDEHEDLFWALRGGGGNYGVVTSFVFRMHPIAEVVGGLIAHPIDTAADLLRLYSEATAEASDELTIFGGLVHAPDGSGLPLAALVLCHAGPRERAMREVEPLLSWGTPAMVEVGPMPYPVMNTLLDPTYPKGSLNYWKSTFVRGVDDGLIEAMIKRFESCPTPLGAILLEHFHGAVTRVGREETAVPHREVGHNLLIPTVWSNPAATDDCIAWTRETYETVAPHRIDARWLNYYGDDEDAEALDAAYGPNRARLGEVKRSYDPGNVFHLNQNIQPATAPS